jgi:hypothetical protein
MARKAARSTATRKPVHPTLSDLLGHGCRFRIVSGRSCSEVDIRLVAHEDWLQRPEANDPTWRFQELEGGIGVACKLAT